MEVQTIVSMNNLHNSIFIPTLSAIFWITSWTYFPERPLFWKDYPLSGINIQGVICKHSKEEEGRLDVFSMIFKYTDFSSLVWFPLRLPPDTAWDGTEAILGVCVAWDTFLVDCDTIHYSKGKNFHLWGKALGRTSHWYEGLGQNNYNLVTSSWAILWLELCTYDVDTCSHLQNTCHFSITSGVVIFSYRGYLQAIPL